MKTTEVLSFKDRIHVKGKPVDVNVIRVDGSDFVRTGRMLRVAELKDPWPEDVEDPVAVSNGLKKEPLRVDILKFWQRVPDTAPRYSYMYEWRYIAAIPVTTHKHWFEKQIPKTARTKIRKAAREGVEVQEEQLSDRLIRDIMQIYNDSPIRRGKPFWHYGKDFDTVKKELSDDLDKAVFLTAYYQGELLGFIKCFLLDRYVKTSLVLDKVSRRQSAPTPMNSLFSKMVEICADKGLPHVVYSWWRLGNHGQFQENNGFIRTPVPEYWVPLTIRGRLALLLKLHHGFKGWIPERMMIPLLTLRAKWYAWRLGTKAFRFSDK